jgi:hypothetical protein
MTKESAPEEVGRRNQKGARGGRYVSTSLAEKAGDLRFRGQSEASAGIVVRP